jgi:hypothetical protein
MTGHFWVRERPAAEGRPRRTPDRLYREMRICIFVETHFFFLEMPKAVKIT